MEQKRAEGFLTAHRQYMRANIRLRGARREQEAEKAELFEQQQDAGNRMIKALREAQTRGLNFRDFYTIACEAVGESDPFLLLDWEEEQELLLGVRLAELEHEIQEEEGEHAAKRGGLEVFLGSLANPEGFSREISERYKQHAHILWQLVRKGHGLGEIVGIRNQAMRLTAEEIERLRKQR